MHGLPAADAPADLSWGVPHPRWQPTLWPLQDCLEQLSPQSQRQVVGAGVGLEAHCCLQTARVIGRGARAGAVPALLGGWPSFLLRLHQLHEHTCQHSPHSALMRQWKQGPNGSSGMLDVHVIQKARSQAHQAPPGLGWAGPGWGR